MTTTTNPQRAQRHADQFGRAVAHRLAGSIEELPYEVSERLRAARVRALQQRKQAAARTAPVVLGADGAATLGKEEFSLWTRIGSVLPLVALVGGLVLIHSFQAERRASEIAEVDAALLTDDLPPAAYADPGFLQFLEADGPRMSGGQALRRAAVLLALCAGVGAVFAADPPASTSPSVSSQPAPKRPPPVRVAQAAKVESTPSWGELTPPQQQALAPLTGSWSRLSEAHKRKWLAVSANYPTMPPAEQARLHSRMGEWAALSPQQRTQARLNFAASKAVPDGDKKAKWEAYQALPPEEKRKLAAGARAAKPPAPPTAAAVQPEPPQKLARPPKEAQAARPNTRTPRIAGTASVDTNVPPPSGTAPVQR